MASDTRALGQVTLAYVWWGSSAIFWSQLDTVNPVDQVGFRVVTAFAYLALGGVLFRRQLAARGVRASLFEPGAAREHLTPRHLTYGVGAALAIVCNWGLFLWAVSNGQAVEAALGYFLMPILSVGLGVGFLGERLRPLQLLALALSVVGIVWTVAVLGRLPVVAILVAVTFALYGLFRKQGPWDAVSGLTFETGLIAPFLIVILAWRVIAGEAIVGNGTASTLILLALTGVVTMVPLLAFASASRRVPLSLVGLLQYINPTLQFLVGWQILDEAVSGRRLVGFAFIWVALVLIIFDELAMKQPKKSEPGRLGITSR